LYINKPGNWFLIDVLIVSIFCCWRQEELVLAKQVRQGSVKIMREGDRRGHERLDDMPWSASCPAKLEERGGGLIISTVMEAIYTIYKSY
jgi:hypothetical protein